MATKTQTNEPPPEVIRDLLDPDLDSAEVARRHNLDPFALQAAVRSDAFRHASDAMREVDRARTAAVLPAVQSRAIHRLARIANQPTETPAQTESARRALTALLKCKLPDGTGVTPVASTPEPAPEPAPRGHRADGAAPRTPPNATAPTAAPTLGDLITALSQTRPTPPGPTTHPAPDRPRKGRPTNTPTPAQLLARTGVTRTADPW